MTETSTESFAAGPLRGVEFLERMVTILDEMFSEAAARLLRERYGREAVHVSKVGLGAAADAEVAAVARSDGWALVTENVVDFAHERDLVVVSVFGGISRAVRPWTKSSRHP